jgi:alkanesulfonate monooxygenase SsuD/methylene tetrahydromethanopterin reductase-like flavin-dependent oxidoreductase (luciferase family)
MLALAGREADGAILNWLAASDVAQCRQAIANADAEVVARIFVCPTEDTAHAHAAARRVISAYLTVPAYAAFHDWLGRGGALAPMHRAWAAGDRTGAAAAIPEKVLDELVVHGSPEACRTQVRAYVEAGVDTPVLALLPTPEATDAAALHDLVRELGPG